MNPAISVQHLSKHYGAVHAARDVSFDVAPGEIFGLLGPNGAGKTTTLECLIGLRRPDTGTIHVAGIDALATPAAARQKIGVQLQSTALHDKITPRQALDLFASFYESAADPVQLMVQFGIIEKAHAPFDTLSGGQRQRLAIALALIHQPDIVVLDEPTSGLDPEARLELQATISQLKSAGKAVLLTTHFIADAEKLCDRIALMNSGEIVAMGAPAQLIAAANILPRILFQASRPLTQAQASALSAVTSAAFDKSHWQLTTASVAHTTRSLMRLLEAENNELLDIQIHQPTLQDVLTKKPHPFPLFPQ